MAVLNPPWHGDRFSYERKLAEMLANDELRVTHIQTSLNMDGAERFEVSLVAISPPSPNMAKEVFSPPPDSGSPNVEWLRKQIAEVQGLGSGRG